MLFRSLQIPFLLTTAFQNVQNYLINHKFDGLTPEEVETLKGKGKGTPLPMNSHLLYKVMRFKYRQELDAEAKADKSKSSAGTKALEAAKRLFENFEEPQKVEFINFMNEWAENGAPIEQQIE